MDEPSDEAQVLAAGEVGVDGRVLAGQPDLRPDFLRLAHDVSPEHLGSPGVRLENRRQDPDRRGLAGAVRPEQTKDGARRDLEIDPVERGHVVEALGEPIDPNGEIGHRLTAKSPSPTDRRASASSPPRRTWRASRRRSVAPASSRSRTYAINARWTPISAFATTYGFRSPGRASVS